MYILFSIYRHHKAYISECTSALSASYCFNKYSQKSVPWPIWPIYEQRQHKAYFWFSECVPALSASRCCFVRPVSVCVHFGVDGRGVERFAARKKPVLGCHLMIEGEWVTLRSQTTQLRTGSVHRCETLLLLPPQPARATLGDICREHVLRYLDKRCYELDRGALHRLVICG
jgi:hypothetical protein